MKQNQQFLRCFIKKKVWVYRHFQSPLGTNDFAMINIQFLKAPEPGPIDDGMQDQGEEFEDETLKLLKAWRTFLVVSSSFQVGKANFFALSK